MTRDEARFLAGFLHAECPDLEVNGRPVVVSLGNDFADAESEQATGWYVRIDKAEEE